jgi:S1-C subfamily serine protease
MVFKDDRYIGSKLHVIGIPFLSKVAHFELRKLRVTHPKIEFYFDPKEEDEAVLWLGYDISEMAKALGEDPDSGEHGDNVSSSGTGFYVHYDGYLITNDHVVAECKSISVQLHDKELPTIIVRTDPTNDIALLKTEKTPKVIGVFRQGRSVRTGEEIFAIGYPLTQVLSDDLKITDGLVNSLKGLGNNSRMLQISAPVQPGNSGGPLLDRYGNIVGVVTSKIDAVKIAQYTGDVPQNINFALKASVVRDLLDSEEIDYGVAPSQKKMEVVDIFRMAKEFTALVGCWE